MATPTKNPEVEQPLVAHLIELRTRVLRAVTLIGILFLCMMPFASQIFDVVAIPLLKYYLPEGTRLQAIEVASGFFIPFKTAMVFAFFLSVPYVLYQAWAFVAPGLYQHERRIALPLLVSSTLLFYLGMAFSFFVVIPMALGFLKDYMPATVVPQTDIGHYYNFILKMFFAFGVAFEVPVATFILVWTGLTSAESLAEKRRYIIVLCFIVGMLLTPPDVLSQFMLAVPMWMLFEVGLLASRYFIKKEDENSIGEAQAAVADEQPYRPRTDAEVEEEFRRIELEELQMDEKGLAPKMKGGGDGLEK